MVILETEGAQGGLEIVQAKTLGPKPNPVIGVVGDKEFVIVPEPDSKVQAPLPITGVLAVIVAVGTLKQTV